MSVKSFYLFRLANLFQTEVHWKLGFHILLRTYEMKLVLEEYMWASRIASNSRCLNLGETDPTQIVAKCNLSWEDFTKVAAILSAEVKTVLNEIFFF